MNQEKWTSWLALKGVKRKPALDDLRAELEALRAQLTQAREALSAADKVMWMAREYAEWGGAVGPEMYQLREAENAILTALASHPSSPEEENP